MIKKRLMDSSRHAAGPEAHHFAESAGEDNTLVRTGRCVFMQHYNLAICGRECHFGYATCYRRGCDYFAIKCNTMMDNS